MKVLKVPTGARRGPPRGQAIDRAANSLVIDEYSLPHNDLDRNLRKCHRGAPTIAGKPRGFIQAARHLDESPYIPKG